MSNINNNNNDNNNLPQFNRGSSSSSIFPYATLNSSNETLDHQTHNYRELNTNPNPNPNPNQNLDPDPMPQPLLTSPSTNNIVEPAVRYKECQKNHAANMGAYVVDGCGEFMANGEPGTPEGLKCAACECHRSFHRREVDGPQNTQSRPAAVAMQAPYQQHHQQHQRLYNHQVPPIMVAFGGNSVAPTDQSSSEDLDVYQHVGVGHQPVKKRFRTKITEEQKVKMHDFAEKIGWKIERKDEQEILQFCEEVGLKRKVFKVWMHNSKQASKKKQE